MIRVTTLVDNMVYRKRLKAEHGLSLFIELNNTNILFDLGQSKILFNNAKELGVNIKEVDILIISHGHYDHTGGLEKFLDLNKKAKVYISKSAFVKRYNSRGEDVSIKNRNRIYNEYYERFVFTQEINEIAKNINIFGKIKTKEYTKNMKVEENKEIKEDKFDDEIYLLIKDEEELFLFSGCSHKGIVSISKVAKEIFCLDHINYLIGGMHLSKMNESEIYKIKKELIKMGIENIIPMHCTGMLASAIINKHMLGGVGKRYEL